MHQTNFQQNFNNKLTWDRFGDARMLDKEKYYEGNVVEIVFQGRSLGFAKIVACPEFSYGQLRDSFSFLNCGKHAAYQATLLNRFYNQGQPLPASTKLQHVVFEYTERNMEQHRELLKAWWDDKVAQQPFITESENPIS